LKNNFLTSILFLLICACQPKASYLDQETPGLTPELFAPGIVNTDSVELNAVFNHSMNEFFFTRIINESFIIHRAELQYGAWTSPQPIRMFPEDVPSWAVDMTITEDGQTMYFLGKYTGDGQGHNTLDIYKSLKLNGYWQPAKRVPAPVSTDDYSELYPVVVADGSLYFISDRPGGVGRRDVYRAQYMGDEVFDTPISLGPIVNAESGQGDTYVASDESYMVYSTTTNDTYGMHVAFKDNDEWQAPIYLGAPINTDVTDFCPYMTPDHKYFFFSRRYSKPPGSGWNGVTEGEVYWVDAKIIFDLRK